MHNQTKFEFRNYMLYIFMFINLLQCRRAYFKFTILLPTIIVYKKIFTFKDNVLAYCVQISSSYICFLLIQLPSCVIPFVVP